MKIISVVGARPNFMKIAPILVAIKAHNKKVQREQTRSRPSVPEAIQHVLVHTGQHYDGLMSDVFFADLDLPRPDIHLGVGSASHAVQTAEIMKRFESVLLQEKPEVVLVVGDVNSTLACALVAAKMPEESGALRPLVAHVEAGLRSFDRLMPEEYNRILTDHLSDLLFVTEESGMRHLRKEGIAAEKLHFVGNTMIDSLLAFREKAEASTIFDRLNLRQRAQDGSGQGTDRYALLTLHRPSNVDTPSTLLAILQGMDQLAARCPVIFPAHPRTQRRIQEFGLEHYFDPLLSKEESVPDHPFNGRRGIRLVDPLGYLDFLGLMKHAALVITDSGGIQEETTCLGVPCVTVRENTERPVTVKVGTNRIAGVSQTGIRKAIREQLNRKRKNGMPEKWDGKSATRIVEVIWREVKKRRAGPG